MNAYKKPRTDSEFIASQVQIQAVVACDTVRYLSDRGRTVLVFAAPPSIGPAEPATNASAPSPAAPLVSIPSAVPLGKRVALVIGNAQYQNIGRLDNPANDANLIAQALKEDGFELVGDGAQLELDKAELERAVQDFGNRLQGAEVALFYYAGHGVQVRGANYLVPVNANPTKETDVDFQMLDANLVLR